jgi:Fungal fucose-specific lectin
MIGPIDLPHAFMGTSLATVGGLFFPRLYFQNAVNLAIVEYCRNGPALGDAWGPGTAGFSSARPGTSIAAVSFQTTMPSRPGTFINTQDHIRVYFQTPDNSIVQYAFDQETGWDNGTKFEQEPTPAPGTALAALAYGSGSQIRLYYQDTSGFLRELVLKNDAQPVPYMGACPVKPAFQGGRFAPNLLTGLAAIQWDDDVHGLQVRIYYQNTSGVVEEIVYTNGNWQPAPGAGTASEAARGSSLAAVYFNSGGPNVRVYYQDTNGMVREKTWPEWADGPLRQPAQFGEPHVTPPINPSAVRNPLAATLSLYQSSSPSTQPLLFYCNGNSIMNNFGDPPSALQEWQVPFIITS